MLSTDRSVPRADQRRRTTARIFDDALWEQAQPFDPHAPWDQRSAEALTRLYESDEGRLSRPAAGDRTRPSPAASAATAGPGEAVDRAWLETHLSNLAERLQGALAQANPEPSLAALNGRLETFEQRFCTTLGRVAQREDLDGLRAIEARVLDLAGQLEQARERLDRIGAVDDQVRALAHRLEESGVQRASGLEKLLRDCIAEWREGEQRTAGTLHNIEEAISRLGEAVDAMEASKPAPDLTVPPLTGAELDLAMVASSVQPHAEDERASTLYHSLLDAADYAPKALAGEPTAAPLAMAPAQATEASTTEWPPEDGAGHGRPSARLTPGALRIMALRAKLRRSNGIGRGGMRAYMSAGALAAPGHGTIKRASLSVLLMASAAFLAGSTYYLYQTFLAAAPAGPVRLAPGASSIGAPSDLADPVGRPASGKGAS